MEYNKQDISSNQGSIILVTEKFGIQKMQMTLKVM